MESDTWIGCSSRHDLRYDVWSADWLCGRRALHPLPERSAPKRMLGMIGDRWET